MNNIALCLFTSTKGHFDIKTRYSETIRGLDKNILLGDFGERIAHIKVSPNEMNIFWQMKDELESFGFKVYETVADWKHGEVSHQAQYLADMLKLFMTKEVQSMQYALFFEDDMLIFPRERDLEYYLYKSQEILKSEQDIVSVRIPRAQNERERINKLTAKHGIPAFTADSREPDLWFKASDFSNNPHLCRSRDMRNALLLMAKNPNAFMVHSEMGLGPAIKYFSLSQTPIAVFNPEKIVARHIGTKPGEEEKADQNYISD